MALIRHDSLIRLFAAGFCIVVGALTLAVSLTEGEWLFPLMRSCALFAVAWILLNRDWWRMLRGLSEQQIEAELERKGEITHETVRARRAIHLFDHGCSCDVYLIDCEDGRLLCLFGQYFYDWEPIEEHGVFIQGRGFPTREFVVTRRAPDQSVYKLQPGKKLIHPEIVGGDISLLREAGMELTSSDGCYLPMSYDQIRQIMRREHAAAENA